MTAADVTRVLDRLDRAGVASRVDGGWGWTPSWARRRAHTAASTWWCVLADAVGRCVDLDLRAATDPPSARGRIGERGVSCAPRDAQLATARRPDAEALRSGI